MQLAIANEIFIMVSTQSKDEINCQWKCYHPLTNYVVFMTTSHYLCLKYNTILELLPKP